MKKYIMIICIVNIFFLYAQEKEKDVFKNKGFFNITKFTHSRIQNATLDYKFPDNSEALGRDVNHEGGNANGLHTITGVFLGPKFSLGAGLGIERFNTPNANTMPLYLDVRYYFNNDYNSFYLFSNLGTMVKLGDDFRKGGLFQAGIGYKFFILDQKLAMVTDAGYYHRLLKIPEQGNPNDSDLILNGFMFSIGILF
jgi:hypothetical protein